MIAEIDGHAIFHVLDEFVHLILVLAATEYAGNLIAGGVAGELGRGRHEEARGTAGGIEFAEIIGIELDNLPLLGIHSAQILRIKVGVHGLGHAADQHVEAEIPHQFAAGGISDALTLFEGVLHERDGGGIAHCPAEFLIVHRVHLDAGFLTWDNDALGVLLDGEEGARLDVVIPVVFNQILDGLADLGGFLDLVEDDDGLALFQADVIDELQLEEEAVAVVDMGDGFPDFIGGIGKVDLDVGGVLVLGEFLCYGGLAYAAGAFDKKGRGAVRCLLPFLEFLVYLAFEYALGIFHVPHFLFISQTQK